MLDDCKIQLEEIGIPLYILFVKGHCGNVGNERAHQLAVAGADKPLPMVRLY